MSKEFDDAVRAADLHSARYLLRVAVKKAKKDALRQASEDWIRKHGFDKHGVAAWLIDREAGHG